MQEDMKRAVPDRSSSWGPWYVGSFVIKKLEASYYAWSLDWDEVTGLGVELGPFSKLDEAKKAACNWRES